MNSCSENPSADQSAKPSPDPESTANPWQRLLEATTNAICALLDNSKLTRSALNQHRKEWFYAEMIKIPLLLSILVVCSLNTFVLLWVILSIHLFALPINRVHPAVPKSHEAPVDRPDVTERQPNPRNVA